MQSHEHSESEPPAGWLLDHEHLLPRTGSALDVACGRGRHALWLAARGLETLAVDRNPQAVAVVNEEAVRRGLPLQAVVMDLEGGSVNGLNEAFDVITCLLYTSDAADE